MAAADYLVWFLTVKDGHRCQTAIIKLEHRNLNQGATSFRTAMQQVMAGALRAPTPCAQLKKAKGVADRCDALFHRKFELKGALWKRFKPKTTGMAALQLPVHPFNGAVWKSVAHQL
jgi:hypothetical protein